MNHGIDGLIHCICDGLFKRGRKIRPAQVASILAVAEMRVTNVEKVGHSQVANV